MNKPNRFKVDDRLIHQGDKYLVIKLMPQSHLNYCLLRKLTGYNAGHEGQYWDQMLDYDKEYYREEKIKEVMT